MNFRNSITKSVTSSVVGLAFLAGTILMGSGAGLAGSKKEPHPEIRKALAACNIAALDLEDGSHDFCGYREQALDATNNAINQMELAIACDSGSTPSPAMSRGAGEDAPSASSHETKEQHRDLRKALAALQLAAGALEDASHDFCGHREDALTAVENAITDIELAIACDEH